MIHNPTPGYIFRENHGLKEYMHPNVHCGSTAKARKPPTCLLTDEWIKKMWYPWNITQFLKEWNNAIFSNIDAARGYHTKWIMSKTNIVWHLLYEESLKNDTNELMYKTADLGNKFMVTKGERGGGVWGKNKLGAWYRPIHTTIFKIDNNRTIEPTA